MENKTITETNHKTDHSRGHHRTLEMILGVVGAFLAGCIIGFLLSVFFFKKCSRKKRDVSSRTGSYRVSRDVEARDGVNNRFYIYGTAPDSSIYGTPDTYLTQDERRILGMGSVKKNVHTQTDPPKEPPDCSKKDEDEYDYTFAYVVYQNVIQTLMNPKHKTPADPEVHYVNEFYSRPEVLFCRREDSSDEEPRKQTTRTDCDCADLHDYLSPHLIHPKKEQKQTASKVSVNRNTYDCTSGSDSDSERELVDDDLQKYAHSLRIQKKFYTEKEKHSIKTRKKHCGRESEFCMSIKTNMTGSCQKPAPSKRSRQKPCRNEMGKSDYMVMKLTPEIWEILKNHKESMKAAKEAEIHPRPPMTEKTRPQRPPKTEASPPQRPPKSEAASYHKLRNARRRDIRHSEEEDEEDYIKVIE